MYLVATRPAIQLLVHTRTQRPALRFLSPSPAFPLAGSSDHLPHRLLLRLCPVRPSAASDCIPLHCSYFVLSHHLSGTPPSLIRSSASDAPVALPWRPPALPLLCLPPPAWGRRQPSPPSMARPSPCPCAVARPRRRPWPCPVGGRLPAAS